MEKISILLACNAGMSTSLLVDKMKEAAEAMGMEAVVDAQSVEKIGDYYNDYDVLLIGPQIGYKLKQVKEEVGEALPVGVIDMSAYGLMDGDKVVRQALSLLGAA